MKKLIERSPLRRRPLVLVGLSESTPEARDSADFGCASICRQSLQADRYEMGSKPTDPQPAARRNHPPKRLGLKNPIGSFVPRVVARSASTSPITGANLKPWPLKPQAIATFACDGCSPTTKSVSADIV